jgi:hypothetical protein
MGRSKRLTGGRVFTILLAGMIGYLIGGWHPTALRSEDLSAAQSVALRFPQQWDTVAPIANEGAVVPSAGAPQASAPMAAPNEADDEQFALLNPEPMVPQVAHPADPQAIARPWGSQTWGSQAPVQLASIETDAPPPAAIAAAPTHSPKISAAMPAIAAPPRVNRAPVAPRHAVMNRPGYMLDDAQIASIKERLHLTPEQQQMWPAVEAALRNIAYTHAQQLRRRAGSGDAQLADIDPESVEGLKSAAVPLIMSFDEDQKQEVRNLAHVMGLDQLASEF